MALTNPELANYRIQAYAENRDLISIGCAPIGYGGAGPE